MILSKSYSKNVCFLIKSNELLVSLQRMRKGIPFKVLYYQPDREIINFELLADNASRCRNSCPVHISISTHDIKPNKVYQF